MNLYRRNFGLFSLGRLVSLIGSGIQALALSLYILDITGSGSKMGTFLIFSLLPRVVFSPLAGIVGDRVNRKLIMVLMDFLRGIVILSMAFINRFHQLSILHIYMFQFVVSILDTFFDPVTSAMLPELVPEKQLTRANSLLGAMNSISYIIGPALGGVLYPLGIEIVFYINGISFVLSGISELFIVYQQTTKKIKMTVTQVWEDFIQGIRYFKERKKMTAIMIFAMITNFLAAPVIMVVVPYFAREIVGFSSYQYGLMETSWVVGTLIGNVLLATLLASSSIGNLFRKGIWGQMICFLVFSIVIFPYFVTLFGGASWVYLVIISISFMLIGLYNAFVNTPLSVYYQKTVPSQMRTRVFSVMSVLSQLIVPLGIALYGFLTDHYASHIIVFVSWFVTLAAMIWFYIKGTFKVLDQESSTSKPSIKEC